jgi:hypothetical protein
MKDSVDGNSILTGLIEDDVTALLDPANAGMNGIGWSSELGKFSDSSETFGKAVQVEFGLSAAPYIRSVVKDVGEIHFGQG